MNRISILIILGLLIANYSCNKNRLKNKTQTLELKYIAWACDCANWVTNEDLENYSENFDDTLAEQSIFIEPANKTLKLPDTLGYSNDVIKFTGQFYNEKGFPKNYHSFQEPEKSRVFRYTNYEVVVSNYNNYKYLEHKSE